MTAVSNSSGAESLPRRDSVDFWRGLVLCTIFINHIPGNVFETLTQKNLGFSDSAEAFVFLSGVSMALAYGRRFFNGDVAGVTGTLARRAAKLYGVHILLSIAGVSIFAAGAVLGGDLSLLDQHGRDLIVDDPKAAVVGLLSLGHQFGYFNILPMYVLMLAVVPPLLWLGRTSSGLMLTVSFTIYAAARVFDVNVPTWPMRGTWFFNPFAWQFLLAIGIAIGLAMQRRAVSRMAVLLIPSLVIVGYAAFSVTNGLSFYPGFQDWTRGWADLDKTVLGLGRLVHFGAVAYLLFCIHAVAWFRRMPIFKPLCMMGRNSLWMFALLSLFAAVGQVLTDIYGHGLVLDSAIIGTGLVALHQVAVMLEHRRETALRPLTA